MKPTGAEIRKKYLQYFKSLGHEIVPSSSLVPHGDPTILFTNAGMNQFKDLFLGAEKRSYTRATTSQKCMRVSGKHNDLENIGVTARHHTFFEMLGNFSFGDYFKKDAINYAWNFIVKELNLPKERLWVTIFENDDEAGDLWHSVAGVSKDRIIKLGEKDNFWAMGDTGPCGPCTEIHYFLGDDLKLNTKEKFLGTDDGSFLEIWNNVFMQFNRSKDGVLTPLPKPSVDTGMGLERITSVIQGVKSNYDTDLLRPIINTCENLSGFSYDGSSFVVRNLKTDLLYAQDVAMRVIADHSRAISCMIADGVMPSSAGRGYVLRRILRRAVRHGKVLQLKEPFLIKTCETAIDILKDEYPELKERTSTILNIVDAEERKFHETLDDGLQILQKTIDKLPEKSKFPGEAAFLLHDTYGFPLDLTEDALKPYGISVDEDGFNKAMSQQKQRSRDDRKSKGITFPSVKIDAPKTEFIGYDNIECEAVNIKTVKSTSEDEYILYFNKTPFYAESGGQVGDTGTITFSNAKFEVIDTQKIGDGFIAHAAKLVDGGWDENKCGDTAILNIDIERRNQIRAHHSATHMLHLALRKYLGEHIKQSGSKVDENLLRFDFSHFEPISKENLEKIVKDVNTQIWENYEVTTTLMSIDEAKKTGAMALFGEKYGDTVRVIKMGDSLELCGGTHLLRTGSAGTFAVLTESGVAAGVRRIEATVSEATYNLLSDYRTKIEEAAALLKSSDTELLTKIQNLLDKTKDQERELQTLKGRQASLQADELIETVKLINGIKVISSQVPECDIEALKTLADTLRVKISSGLVILVTQSNLVVGVTPDMAGKLHAGNITKKLASIAGGKGGGRADFAQAGGLQKDKINELLKSIETSI